MTVPSGRAESAYRPDIDGLRAVAVLSVIFFHIKARLLPGGFVGVDVFFVISGFLISLHIFQELEAGRFSLVEFYRRRIKRIAPPLLVVVALTVLVGQRILLPEDGERVAESGLWSLASLANVYFWLHQDTGYFAAASRELPLLHLWSLGVEEQFYIVWPLVLMAVYRPGRARALGVAATLVALASFGLAQAAYGWDASFVYFMLPTRAGQLLAGAILALAVLRGWTARLSPSLAAPAGMLGGVLVVSSLALLDEKQVFPGVLAIPPTVGAALVILAGHLGANPVSRMLSLGPMVWVGRVSYSAYLWHWPLLAFYYYAHREMDPAAGVAIFVATFVLAWLTLRWVEGPARRSRLSALKVALYQYVLPGGVLGALCVGAMLIDGYGLRWWSPAYKAELAALRDETRPAYQYDYTCQRQRVGPNDARDPRCVIGTARPDAPVALLLGDSNAAHYAGVVGRIAEQTGLRVRSLAVGGCPPLLDDPARFVRSNRLADCRASAGPVSEALAAADIVIVSAAWTAYEAQSADYLKAQFATLERLQAAGKPVLILGNVPIIAGYDRRCREKAISYPGLDCHYPVVANLSPVVEDMNRRLAAYAAGQQRMGYFDLLATLCRDGRCSVLDDRGRPLYYDDSHLSMPASWRLGEAIVARQGVPEPFRIVTLTSRPPSPRELPPLHRLN